MQPKDYLNLIKRWVWLIAIGVVLGALGGFIFSKLQTPLYQASTKVLVQLSPESQVSNVTNQNDTQLAQTFTELIVTRPVLDATSEKLGYNVSAGQIQVQSGTSSQMIKVTIQDQDPQHAADIANTLVTTFLAQNSLLQNSQYSSAEESLQAQISQVEGQIADLQKQLADAATQSQEQRIQAVTDIMTNLQNEIAQVQQDIITLQYKTDLVPSVTNAGLPIMATPTLTLDEMIKINHDQEHLSELKDLLGIYQNIYVDLSYAAETGGGTGGTTNEQIQSALDLYQQIYSNLLTNQESIRLAGLQSTPNLVQVEEALPNGNPISPKTLYNILIGLVVGLVLAGAVVFIREYLDESLRDANMVQDVLGLPVLGYISEIPNHNGDNDLPYVKSEPRSPITEAFRSLRNNLEFSSIDDPLKSILVTSSTIGEGKTTLAVNLAMVMAQSERKTVLVDTDLRRPQVHDKLHIHNQLGLSNLLVGTSTLEEAVQYIEPEHLAVLTSGRLPPNPAEVLGSQAMANVLQKLEEEFDTVILDGVPFLLADASPLAARVDGVLIVVRPRFTSRTVALEMVEQLDRVKARVIGVALNRIRESGASYYRALTGYSNYAYFKEENAPKE